MLRNFLALDEGRNLKIGPQLMLALDYFIVVRHDTFKVLKDTGGLTTGKELPRKQLAAWIKEREKTGAKD